MEAITSALPSSWPATAAAAATAVALYFSTLVVYRLFLHPLAKFPGPKLAAITRYYEFYYDIVQNGQYESRIKLMHQQYGPVVRISPYELHIKDPSYYEKLFRHDGRWDKYAWNVRAHNAHGAIIFTPEHDLHKKRRQPLNAFFSKARVVKHLGLVQASLDKLCQRFADVQGTGRVIDIGAASSAFQRDVSTEFLLGRNFNNLDLDDFGRGMTLFMQAGGQIWRLTKHIRWWGPLMLSIPREFLIKNGGDENLANWLRYVITSENDTARLLKAASNPEPEKQGPRTIVHEIANSSLPPEDKTLQRVFDDVTTVTGAGFETTSSVLRLILYYVWTNPEILGRLRAELATAAAQEGVTGKPLELRTLEQLPYLTGILMEAMRLSPALGTRLQRIAPDRDLVYNQWTIPAGTPVGMTALDIHLDEELYPEPDKFIPDRWVDPEARKRMEKVYAPFSRGTRICLGMHLAWAELYMVISQLAQKFDFDFQGLTEDHFEIESDQFIISTKGKAVLMASVAAYKG